MESTEIFSSVWQNAHSTDSNVILGKQLEKEMVWKRNRLTHGSRGKQRSQEGKEQKTNQEGDPEFEQEQIRWARKQVWSCNWEVPYRPVGRHPVPGLWSLFEKSWKSLMKCVPRLVSLRMSDVTADVWSLIISGKDSSFVLCSELNLGVSVCVGVSLLSDRGAYFYDAFKKKEFHLSDTLWDFFEVFSKNNVHNEMFYYF